MADDPASWRRQAATLLELFVIGNLAFLAVDTYLAHSVNEFRHPAEWIPFFFSIAAPLLLLVDRRRGKLGVIVGGASIALGIAGLLFHLESQFFVHHTLRSLVYTAPFAAPLSYTGLGFLVLLNRLMSADDRDWARWVVLLAAGGFGGNFVLSVADHAQNGFFHVTEWIPVAASACAVGFLVSVVAHVPDRGFVRLALAIMALQIVVGAAGFVLHLAADVTASGALADRFIHGAPVFAPLLFADLALLGGFGVMLLDEPAAA